MLWGIPFLADNSAKKLTEAISEMTRDVDQVSEDDNQQQASNIVVVRLSDRALSVIRTVIGNPKEMMEKVKDRYDSKSTASKIAKCPNWSL